MARSWHGSRLIAVTCQPTFMVPPDPVSYAQTRGRRKAAITDADTENVPAIS